MKRRSLHKQAGVALVTAIFLLVVLAGLAVAMVSLSTSQQDAAVKDEMGTRAYLAAKSGMEWALFSALQGAPGVTPYDRLNCGAPPLTFPLPAGTLAGFSVTVECTQPALRYQAANVADDPTAGHFTITVTACNQPSPSCPANNPGPDYVQRRISAQL
jgi:MSHA biogenesis protein MshP